MKQLLHMCLLNITLLLLVFGATTSFAQTTAFTYQGQLNDNNQLANGNHDFEFKLFDAPSGGGQQGSTLQKSNVVVTNGIFAVQLDFGATSFPGANRFLEIAVRPPGGGAFTTLTPRQPVTPTPYSIRSTSAANADSATNAQNANNATTAQNALQLGGTPANQFVLGNDPRLSDPRIPLPGSSFYLQNTIAPQASSDFNISGDGTAGGTLTGNIVSATTQFNIGGAAVLKSPGLFNFFAGINAGFSNTTGTGNAFFGLGAGVFNTAGGSNAFFGFEAGRNNNVGANNAFFGKHAGRLNTTGSDNSFFGIDAGSSNTTVAGSSFFGARAGNSNTTGEKNSYFGFEAGRLGSAASENSFFGHEAGENNTTGSSNSFFGTAAGRLNSTADDNSFFGFEAGQSTTTGNQNSFFGSGAGRSNTGGSNSYFGYQAGGSSTTGIQNCYFGLFAGVQSTEASDNTFMGTFVGQRNTTGSNNSFFGMFAGNTNTTGEKNTIIGSFADVSGTNLINATAIGADALVTQSDSLVLGSINGVNLSQRDANVGIGTTAPLDRLHVDGILRVVLLGAAGSTNLCRNASNQISTCSSSLRYKTAISPFRSGLNLANRLQPIVFNWKDSAMRDLGLGAEDVEKIEPLLVTYNSKGEVEGVKYDRIAIALLNTFKEQQEFIQQQQKQIDDLKSALSLIRSNKTVGETVRRPNRVSKNPTAQPQHATP